MDSKDRLNPIKKYVLSPIGEFLYPKVCEHCSTFLERCEKRLCQSCLASLSFVEMEGRCQRCLSFLATDFSHFCENCIEKSHYFSALSATFESKETAQTLWKKLQSQEEDYDEICASLMLIQCMKLNYPIPDWVVSVPVRNRSNKKLAEKLAEKMGTSYGDFLQSTKEFCQKGKSRKERELLPENIISWKAHPNLCDKTILVIDTFLVSGQSMYVTSSKLKEAFPKALYGMVFCIS